MKSKSLASPEEQNVAFVELFFDLVFVFSVTQVVSFFHHGLSFHAAGEAVLVFWLVWWAWTQFTWALNAANTDHDFVNLSVLLAGGVTFFMAVSLPEAFGERALWFTISYILVRSIGLVVYAKAAAENPAQAKALKTFTFVSVLGLLAVLAGGILGGTLQFWFWGLAIVLDFGAAYISSKKEGWNVQAEHFAERHGLFVIIALGEMLIVAASGVSKATWTNELLIAAGLTVALTSGLWWTYFSKAKTMIDEALVEAKGKVQTAMASSAFSMTHFPMLCGIIAFAIAFEEVVVHPDMPLSLNGTIALAGGLILFIGGMAFAVRLATGKILVSRLIIMFVSAFLIIFFQGIPTIASLSIAFGSVFVTGLVEHRQL